MTNRFTEKLSRRDMALLRKLSGGPQMTNEKDREESYALYRKVKGSHYVADGIKSIELFRAEAVRPYQDVIDDFHRLTKELDDALNGDGAAKAPSLCDIVAQVRRIGPLDHLRAEAVKAERYRIRTHLASIAVDEEYNSVRQPVILAPLSEINSILS